MERCQDPKVQGQSIRPSSPRSVEAFLRSGIDPEDLVHKPVAFFKERTGDGELARLAYNFFEEGRLKRIEELRSLRQSLVDDGWQPGSARSIVTRNTKDDSGDMLDKERKRLEVLRNRCL